MKKIIRIEYRNGLALVNLDHLMYVRFNYEKEEVNIWLSNGTVQTFTGNARNVLKQILSKLDEEKSNNDQKQVFDEDSETTNEAVLKLLTSRPKELFSTRKISSAMNISIKRARNAAQSLALSALVHTHDVNNRIYYSFQLPDEMVQGEQ